jgi:hypothetical protein
MHRKGIGMLKLRRESPNFLYLLATLCFTRVHVHAAPPLADFPMGYSSNGGTYGFIGFSTAAAVGAAGRSVAIRLYRQAADHPGVVRWRSADDIVAAASPIRAAIHCAKVKFVGGVMDQEVSSLVTSPTINHRTI